MIVRMNAFNQNDKMNLCITNNLYITFNLLLDIHEENTFRKIFIIVHTFYTFTKQHVVTLIETFLLNVFEPKSK